MRVTTPGIKLLTNESNVIDNIKLVWGEGGRETKTQEMMGQEIGRKWHFQQGPSKRKKIRLKEGGDSKEGAGTRKV